MRVRALLMTEKVERLRVDPLFVSTIFWMQNNHRPIKAESYVCSE